MRYTLVVVTLLFSLLACNSEPEAAEAQTNEDRGQQAPSSAAPLKLHPRDSLTLLIRKNPGSAQLLLERARLNLALQDVTDARTDLNQVIQLDSNLAELHELKGELHYMTNQTRMAKDEWEKCLAMDPNNSVCIMRLAELLIAVRDYDRAFKLVNRQLEINETDAQAYFAKGIIVRDRFQDTALALQYFQNAIDLDQNFYEAIDMMAVTLTARNDTLAKFYFDRMLEMEPNDASTYFKLGVYHMGLGNINRALESYTKAIQLDPGNADSYYNLAFMYVELKEYDQARENFSKAIRFQERNYKAYYGRGFTFEVVGDIGNARKDYEKALEILPIYKPAGEALSRLNQSNPQ